ncbi:PH domain-containing protein [Capnocytophaga felis]|uniref:Uncharacterized protein YyaB-like PH domain-containing protein n=1 Tax=Capnocytophaga felis TaxID=2267611 RepID=A0A5M4B9I0_9FLAO|nr:PH domain-containing protein [Capnocytophaga felis]GET46269.1 hypothetical protein RCZ01_15710 [Capnocytophaga felis]GET48099.1 hypothetical protein RCZ02_09300 [Capnocytophaga felis]
MKKVYKSEVDKFLFGIVIAITFFPLIFLLYESTSFSDTIILAIIILLSALLLGNCIWGIRYIIDQKQLIIKAGFLYKVKIDIETIRKIRKSNSILSSPAASFDRIEILYNKYDDILISPKDRTVFISDLLKINPNIEIIL